MLKEVEQKLDLSNTSPSQLVRDYYRRGYYFYPKTGGEFISFFRASEISTTRLCELLASNETLPPDHAKVINLLYFSGYVLQKTLIEGENIIRDQKPPLTLEEARWLIDSGELYNLPKVKSPTTAKEQIKEFYKVGVSLITVGDEEGAFLAQLPLSRAIELVEVMQENNDLRPDPIDAWDLLDGLEKVGFLFYSDKFLVRLGLTAEK